MENNINASKLIRTLLIDTDQFILNKEGYLLLEEFYYGLDINELKNLINSSNVKVHGVAIWIASELGDEIRELMPLINKKFGSNEKSVRMNVLDCITNLNYYKFSYRFLQAIQDSDVSVRVYTMRLLSLAGSEFLSSIERFLINNDLSDKERHLMGIRFLLKSYKEMKNYSEELVNTFMSDELLSKYLAIGSLKFGFIDYELSQMFKKSEYEDLRYFNKLFIKK